MQIKANSERILKKIPYGYCLLYRRQMQFYKVKILAAMHRKKPPQIKRKGALKIANLKFFVHNSYELINFIIQNIIFTSRIHSSIMTFR